MILYVNGDSHAAGHGIHNEFGWAKDDPNYSHLGTQPHPDNERRSFGACLSQQMGWQRINQSQSGGSNQRILRTTRNWLQWHADQLSQVFVLIQWSTWEREEWLHDGVWYQVNASGIDHVPPELSDRYKQFVVNVDWSQVTHQAHDQIYQLHQELQRLGVAHLFFNGNTDFSRIPPYQRQDWDNCYIGPYDPAQTYNAVLRTQQFATVEPAPGFHFGQDAHCFWAQYVLQWIIDNQLLRSHALSTD